MSPAGIHNFDILLPYPRLCESGTALSASANLLSVKEGYSLHRYSGSGLDQLCSVLRLSCLHHCAMSSCGETLDSLDDDGTLYQLLHNRDRRRCRQYHKRYFHCDATCMGNTPSQNTLEKETGCISYVHYWRPLFRLLNWSYGIQCHAAEKPRSDL